jgi:GNAT superfamily N-acetyltransferase
VRSRHVEIVDGRRLGPGQLARVEEIFFEASGRTFPPSVERDAFRERWLGRYLRDPGDLVLLALGPSENVAGYLVGALQDPATQQRFSDISYFRQEFRELCRLYPAHLHINVAPGFRSLGVGSQLIAAFAARAQRAGVRGMHVVTGKGTRNVVFYKRCGFEELGGSVWNSNEVIFLGRSLAPAT